MTLNLDHETSGACPEFENRLEDRVSGELSAADAAVLNEHLETCGGCRAALEHVSLSPRLMRIAEPAPDPGSGFARITMARIRQAERDRADEKSIWSPFVSLAWKFAATSAVAIALLITFDVSRHHGVAADGSYLAAADDSGLFSDSAYAQSDREEFLLAPGAEGTHGKR
jgi:anti-sigma factor RsiW